MSEPGLDHAFLAYIGHDPDRQKAHQRVYVPFFEGCKRVLDLGCGHGDFVELLLEQGIDALGIDADATAARSMRERGLPVVHQDVFQYLHQIQPGSVDGIFAAHLVEHMPYDKVLELFERSYDVLAPGGITVLATPDPRSLYAHLEMFYLHFGHVSFYHPRLLCFFLERAGFVDTSYASNASSVQPDSPLLGSPSMHPIQVTLPVWKRGILRRALRAVRMAVAYVLFRPYLDLIQSNFRRLSSGLQRVDRPFECYVKAVKPSIPEPSETGTGGETKS